MTTRIESSRNEHVVQARKLVQRKHRRQQNRFCAEGLHVLRAAVDAVSRPGGSPNVLAHDVFFCEDLFTSESAAGIVQSLAAAGASPRPVAPRVMESLSSREQSQGVLAIFEAESLVQPVTAWDLPLTDDRQLLLVLDQLQYPGNVGTLVRTADAVGAKGVVLLEPCADPLDPQAVRSSMGSIFSVPLFRAHDPATFSCWAMSYPVPWVAADPHAGTSLWTTDALEQSMGLLLGNEGAGLSTPLRKIASVHVRLPQPGRVDSLNVAVAGGVLMYEWLRRQEGAPRGPGPRSAQTDRTLRHHPRTSDKPPRDPSS